jgi:hypothetical protein
VALEYSIEWLTCAIASRLGGVMVGCAGAAQDRLLAGAPGTRLGCPDVPRERAKEAELLALRHENAVLRRYDGRVRYEPADRVWFAALPSFSPAGAGPCTASILIAGRLTLGFMRLATLPGSTR